MPDHQEFTFRLLDPESGAMIAEVSVTADSEASARDKGRLALINSFCSVDHFEEIQQTPEWMQSGRAHRS